MILEGLLYYVRLKIWYILSSNRTYRKVREEEIQCEVVLAILWIFQGIREVLGLHLVFHD